MDLWWARARQRGRHVSCLICAWVNVGLAVNGKIVKLGRRHRDRSGFLVPITVKLACALKPCLPNTRCGVGEEAAPC